MKRILLMAVPLGAGLALCLTSGCTVAHSVPKTTITGSVAGAPFSVSTPKDSELLGLEITAETNGTAHVHIDSLKARMNPDVITTTGDAQAKMIKATADGIAQGFVAGSQIAGAAAAAAAK